MTEATLPSLEKILQALEDLQLLEETALPVKRVRAELLVGPKEVLQQIYGYLRVQGPEPEVKINRT